MTITQPVVVVEEEVRLDICAREPIHLPGAIQPHGALLVLDAETLQIIQASENTADVLGAPAPELLGSDIGDLVGTDVRASLLALLGTGTAAGRNPLPARVNARDFDVIVRRTDDVGLIEFEPALEDSNERGLLSSLHVAIQRLAGTTDSAQLRRVAAHEIRQLTGFDQVMVYHFHPDDHGEVVADDHADGMTSYLGLHFPASDIPAQARRLYLAKGSGLIADTDYQSAALLPVNNPRTGAPLDLSMAELRSVSPYHRQFMRNMGQGSSFTMSLALDDRLLGLITCAHRLPRRIPFLLRRACEILAQQVALQLGANARAQELTGRLEAQGIRGLLTGQMHDDLDVAGGLTGGVTLLDLITADGATVCHQHRLTSIGQTPSYEQITAFVGARTDDQGKVSALLTTALVHEWPYLARLVPSFAGVFVLPLNNPGDCLIWFRRELLQTVDWLGAQCADNRQTALSPRTSFDAWRQLVTDRSAPWDEIHLAEAAELVRDIDQVLLRRVEAQMAHMGLHDALTGLPNRRLLVDRVTSALDRAARHGVEVAILFCDLDDFKRVNDTAGHAAGDAVLVDAAARLSSVLRSGDSVARVGGDEFVIVLEPAVGDGAAEPGSAESRRPAAEIAERIKTELAKPTSFQDREHRISVSVGITFAAASDRAEDVLRDADVAMYKAKQSGKNRVATFDDSLRAGIFERAVAEQALHTALHHTVLEHSALDHTVLEHNVVELTALEQTEVNQTEVNQSEVNQTAVNQTAVNQTAPKPGASEHPQLTVSYQSVYDLDSGTLVGFEATPTLTDFAGNPVRREVFAYVAEHTALIGALGEAVLEHALTALVAWRAEHPGDVAVMGINFSARQAQQADMPAAILAAVDRHGLQPSDLALALTESVLIEAGSSTLRQLGQLRTSGVSIAINDFGAGYATLSQLALLPVDAIKIDRSFVAGLPDDITNVKIVRAVAGLAKDLGLACVFAGIDRAEQLASLPAGVFVQGAVLGSAATTPRDDRPNSGRLGE